MSKRETFYQWDKIIVYCHLILEGKKWVAWVQRAFCSKIRDEKALIDWKFLVYAWNLPSLIFRLRKWIRHLRREKSSWIIMIKPAIEKLSQRRSNSGTFEPLFIFSRQRPATTLNSRPIANLGDRLKWDKTNIFASTWMFFTLPIFPMAVLKTTLTHCKRIGGRISTMASNWRRFSIELDRDSRNQFSWVLHSSFF